MNDDGLDILGIKPISNSIEISVKKTFEGIEGFLKLVCTPALGEIGGMLNDKVRYWRLKNILSMLEKSRGKLQVVNDKLKLKSNPRIALSIIDNASLIDDSELQDMWAGLFASSCINGANDDENLLFVDLLKQLTKSQASILKYAVENSSKIIHKNGLVVPGELYKHSTSLQDITGISNIHRIDRELDYLRTLGLLDSSNGGFDAFQSELIACITPTYLCLSLFVKCNGLSLSPNEYWKDDLIDFKEVYTTGSAKIALIQKELDLVNSKK